MYLNHYFQIHTIYFYKYYFSSMHICVQTIVISYYE